MQTQVDKDRLVNIASGDPDIDMENFSNYLEYEGIESGQDSKDVGEDVARFSSQDLFDHFNPDRATKSRPGMDEKLTNLMHNSNNDIEEVFRTDAITLDTYEKMSVDAQIAFGTFLFKGWISGLPYTINSPDENIRHIVDYIVGKVYKDVIRNLISTSFKFGFAFGEKVWNRENAIISAPNNEGKNEIIYEGPLAVLDKIKFLDPREGFEFFVDRSDEIVKVEQDQRTPDQVQKEVTVKRKKLIWFALDREFSNVFGRARYKNIYPEWYFSKVNNQYLLNDLQKRGSPHIEIRYPRGNSKLDGEMVSNRKVAIKIAEEMLSDGVVAFPSETHQSGDKRWDLKYAETQQESDQSPFLEYLKYNDKKKLKGLGIPPAVAESDANFSTTDASGDMLTVLVEDVVDQIETAIQRDIVDPIVENNFGPKKKSLVSIDINRSALGRRSLMKEILKNMIKTGSSLKGKTLKSWPDPVSLMDDLGISSGSIDDVFTDVRGGSMDRDSGETLIDEEENIEDSNNTGGDGSRDSVDDRDRDRSTEREDATDSS